MDYDCSGEEVQRRRRGRYRASDLWTQPGNEGGEEEAEEVTVGEEVVVQEEEEETHVLVHRPLLIIEEGNEGGRAEEEVEEEAADGQENVEVRLEDVLQGEGAGGEQQGNDHAGGQ